MLSSFFKRVTSYFLHKTRIVQTKTVWLVFHTVYLFYLLRISMWFRHMYIHGIYNPSIEFKKKYTQT